jgi:hypothetical protein
VSRCAPLGLGGDGDALPRDAPERNGRTTRTRHWLATAAADAALNLCVGVEEKVFVPVGCWFIAPTDALAQ